MNIVVSLAFLRKYVHEIWKILSSIKEQNTALILDYLLKYEITENAFNDRNCYYL